MQNIDSPRLAWRLRAVSESGVVEHEGIGTLDEAVLGEWFHLEQMDGNVWWMRIGDVKILVELKDSGRAVVDVERGAYGDPIEKDG